MTRSREDLVAAASRVIADGAVPLSKLAKKVPPDRQNRRGHVSTTTLVRWITEGRGGVYLDGARLAGKGWCSSEAALARFSAQMAARDRGGPAPPAPCEMERRGRAAVAEIEALMRRK